MRCALAFPPQKPHGGLLSPIGNEVAVTKHMSIEHVFVLCTQAAEKFTVPIRHLTQLFGWDANRLSSIMVNHEKAVGEVIAPLRR
jgi:hypothetical protein